MLMSRPVVQDCDKRLVVKGPSVFALDLYKHALRAPSHTRTHAHPLRTPTHTYPHTTTHTLTRAPAHVHPRTPIYLTHNCTPSCRESHGDLDVEEGVDAPDLILKIHGKKKVKKMRIDSEGEEETDSEQDDDDDDDEEEEV